MKPGPEESTVAVIFKPAELKLIREHTFLAGPLEERLRIWEAAEDGVKIRLTAGDLDELLGYLAVASNHAPSPALQRRLEALYERLQRLEDSPAFSNE